MSEIRHDPVTGHSVILAPQRLQRPSDYQSEQTGATPAARCPFCPGHEAETPAEIDRGLGPSGAWQTRVFENKYPAITAAKGGHEVIVELPDHGRPLREATAAEFSEIIRTWQRRFRHYRNDPRIRTVIIFKNSGRAAGATRVHPHSQLLALPFAPLRLRTELEAARACLAGHGLCPWCDAVRHAGERMVLENERFALMTPWAPRFSYELWIVPTRHQSHFDSAGEEEIKDFARLFREALRRLAAVAGNPPFNTTLMTAPLREAPLEHYHWRLEILPRLGKLAGGEFASGCYFIPVTPEDAARQLRAAASD